MLFWIGCKNAKMFVMKSLKSNWFVYLVIALGFGLRFFVSLRGSNYDFDSFLIVVKLVDHGQNVYANTQRYNYGPIWFNILDWLYLAAFKNEEIFRYFLITTLSFVDLGIFAILWKKINKAAACIFLLNPISIIITGYHNEFDNLAIWMGMGSVLLFGNDLTGPLTRRKFMGLCLLGISLMTKHLFFAFPLWLAVKQKGLFQKVLVLFVPYSLFFLSFIPFLNEGRDGILNNVFLYSSYRNEIFYKLFIPTSLHLIFPSQLFWIILLAISAVYFKKTDPFVSLLYYTCILVAASPSIANQYLAIVIAFISVEFNLIFLLYTLIGTLFLLTTGDGLHFLELWPFGYIFKDYFYSILVFLLSLGLVWRLWRQQLLEIGRWVLGKIKT